MEEYSMKSAFAVAAILVAVSSFPLKSQQPAAEPQQAPPAATQQQAAPPAPEASPAAPAATNLQEVNGKLESKLDSSTAKAGDSVIVKTETSVKTANGTLIPKGSRLVGHVLGVQAQSATSQNSQVAIQFDHAEVKGGQAVPIQTVIKSVGTPQTESAPNSEMPSAPQASAPGASAGPAQSSTPAGGSTARAQSNNPSPGPSSGMGSPQGSDSAIPAGTIVARSGNIAIRTTSIPGVLIANNDQGQDPRMARSSGILLGAKRNIQLDSGTMVELAVADAGTR